MVHLTTLPISFPYSKCFIRVWWLLACECWLCIPVAGNAFPTQNLYNILKLDCLTFLLFSLLVTNYSILFPWMLLFCGLGLPTGLLLHQLMGLYKYISYSWLQFWAFFLIPSSSRMSSASSSGYPGTGCVWVCFVSPFPLLWGTWKVVVWCLPAYNLSFGWFHEV